MAEESTPSVQPTEEKTEVAKPEEEKDKPKFKFKFHPDDFTLDTMLVHGLVRGTIIFHDELRATYRSLNIGELQETERLVDPKRDQDKSWKYLTNEMTIRQIYYALESINGNKLPPIPPEGSDKKDERDRYIRDRIPGQLFDQLVQGLGEFEKRFGALVSGDSLANF